MPASHFHHQAYARTLPGGTGESGIELTFRRKLDDTVITTVEADSEGFFRASLADTATSGANAFVLHPGPYYVTLTKNGITRTHSSSAIGAAGPNDLSTLYQLNTALGTGLISAPANGLNTGAVTADGADRTVDVATFADVVEGLPCVNDQVRALTIGANATGDTRIDTVVIEMVPAGNATEGKCTLKVVEGTTVAPTLTQTTTLWQFPLADVSVANGASTISQGNITDRRDYVERSVTAVEDDLIALEGRVDDLEDATVNAVPRSQLIAYYQAAYDPPSVAGSGTEVALFAPTFLSGVTVFEATDVFVMSHVLLDSENRLLLKLRPVGLASPSPPYVRIELGIRNTSGATINVGSSTLTILVYRLILA